MAAIIKLILEFAEYIKKSGKWWLLPVLVILFITGFMIATAGTSSIPVFIYPIA